MSGKTLEKRIVLTGL